MLMLNAFPEGKKRRSCSAEAKRILADPIERKTRMQAAAKRAKIISQQIRETSKINQSNLDRPMTI